ncbi:transmembrane protein 231-like isoform X2 [Sitophilus oryzae]|nr:transmembrane protein 231-like isoform X2 [Sitophilus oryzae]
MKQDVVYAYPEVKFKGHYLLVVTFDDDTINPIICGSFSNYKRYLKELDTCHTIQIREIDENDDGKPYKLETTFKSNIAKNSVISSVNLMLPVKFKFGNPCPSVIENTILYQNLYSKRNSDIKVYADMQLYQHDLVKCPKYGMTHYNYSIIHEGMSNEEYKLEKILEKYSDTKNIFKTTLVNTITSYIPTKDDVFTISLTVNYPEQKIHHKPRFWHIIKTAWIQFLALYILTAWITNKIKSYIFNNNLVLLYKQKNK